MKVAEVGVVTVRESRISIEPLAVRVDAELGRYVAWLRADRGLTLTDFQPLAGSSNGLISSLERGERRVIGKARLDGILTALHGTRPFSEEELARLNQLITARVVDRTHVRNRGAA